MGPDTLTSKIIGAAIQVHKALGPGLLESTYEQCLAQILTYLRLAGIKTGLLINFNVRLLKNGIRRFVI
ncbi:MAG: GxxExxY protein [Leptospiraceae bacterium]|nr:GxxExxY protein [Leptospiraceae bacterium]